MADFWDDFDKQESGYGMSRSGDFWSGLNETEVTPPKPSSNPVRRLVADPLVGLAKGAAVGIPETVVGLLDIPTMGHAGKVAETVSRGLGLGDFKSANEMFDNLLTPETREAQQKVAEAKGFLPTIATAIQNPSSIVQTVAESIPAMVTGMRVAGGIAKLAGKPLVEAGVANLPRIAKVGGIAEGAITAGQNIEQTRQQTEEGLLTPSQVAINILSGVLTGMIGVAGGKLAQRFGLEDVDTLFTGGRSGIVGDKEKGIFKKVLMGAFQEGVLEELPQSMQEQIAQNLALNKPIDDGIFEAGAMGMLAGFAQSTGANIAGSTMQKMKNELDPINQTIKKLVDETLPGELNAIGGWDNGKTAEVVTPEPPPVTPPVTEPIAEQPVIEPVAPEAIAPEPITPAPIAPENIPAPEAPVPVENLPPAPELEKQVAGAPEIKAKEDIAPVEKVEPAATEGITVYRGGHTLDTSKVTDRGISTSTEKTVAEKFTNVRNAESDNLNRLGIKNEVGGNEVHEFIIDANAKIATKADIPTDIYNKYKEANPLVYPEKAEPILGKWAKENGFDAIDYRTLGKNSAKEAEIKILNPDILRNKAQEAPKAEIAKAEIKPTKEKIASKPPITNQEQLKQRLAEGKRLAAEKRAEIASKPITPIPTKANTFGGFVREQGYNFPEEVEKTSGHPIDKFKELNKKLLKQNNTSYEQLMAVYKASKNIPAKEVSNETKTQTLLGSKSNLKLSTPTREANDENKQDIETLKGEIETDTGRKLGAGSIEEVLFVPKTDKQATGNEPSKQNEGMRDLNAQRRETNQGEVQKIADVFGKKIVWVKINDPDIFFNGGVSDKIPNKIFINVDSTDPNLMVLGHELIHTMKTESPKLYSQLKDYLSPEIKSMDKFKQALDSARSKSGFNTKLEDSIIYEELISEFSGEQFTNKDFWNKLSEKNPTLFEKLSEIAKRIIDKITNVFNKNSNLISSSFFKDIQKSQKVLADVMDEYAKRTEKETGENSNLRLSVSKYIPDSLSSWFKQTSTNSIPPSDISQANGTWEAPQKTPWDAFMYSIADRQIDLRDTQKAIGVFAKSIGKLISDTLNPSQKEQLFSSRLSKRTGDYATKELRLVINEMDRIKATIANIEEYLHARHAEEANNHIRSLTDIKGFTEVTEGKYKGDYINENGHILSKSEYRELSNSTIDEFGRIVNDKDEVIGYQDGGSGMSTQKAKDYLEALDPKTREQYEKIALMVDKITHKNAQLLVEYGVESQDTIDKWFKAYKHYVPLFREDIEERPGTGRGFSVYGKASQMRKGSERKVVNILSNVSMQRERYLTKGEKNRIDQALVFLEKEFPNEKFWTSYKIPDMKTYVPRGQKVETAENVIIARIPNKETGKIEHIALEFNKKDDRAMRMVKALKNMDMDTVGEVMGVISKITRYVASINTQYNPVFGLKNFFRDLSTGLLNLSTTPIAGKQKEVTKNVLPMMRGIFNALNGDMSSAEAKLFEEYQLEGGQVGYRNLWITSEDRAKEIERELKSLQAGKPKQYLSRMAKVLSDYNATMENAVRLSAYKVGIESGMTKEQAAVMAKNLTVNFNKKGQIAGQAGALYAFFNASVQGAVRMYETLKGPMGRKIIAGGIILGATQAMMLAAAGFKDEEPPEFVKERNIIIPIGGKKYITFPMPLGFNVIPNVGRILAEITLGGGKNAGVKMSNLIGMITETFNPMGSSGLSMQTMAPTFLDPFAALAENKDWTGRPIYKEDFNALNPTPGTSRVKDSATVFGRGLAWAFNILTGGDKYTPGMFSPTPDQIDYLGGQITGGLGREIGKTSMMFESLYTGNELPTYRLPLIGTFYGSAEGQANESNKYYSNLKKLNIHEANIKGRIKDREPVGEYIRDNPEAKLWRMANTIENTIGKIKKRKEIARTPEAKKTYDKLITIQQKRLNDMMERVGG